MTSFVIGVSIVIFVIGVIYIVNHLKRKYKKNIKEKEE